MRKSAILTLNQAMGQAVAALRAERGLTQTQAALKTTGFKRPLWVLIESGQRWPSGKSISGIAQALHINPSELFYVLADILNQAETKNNNEFEKVSQIDRG